MKSRRHCPKFIGVLLLMVGLLSLPSPLSALNYPETDLTVSLDRENRLLKGKAVMRFSAEGDRKLSVGDLKIISVEQNREKIKPRIRDGMMTLPATVNIEITIEFESPCGENSPCMISDRGVLLTGNWYPSLKGLSRYRLSASLPPSLTAVSEAEEITVEMEGALKVSTFTFPHPRAAVNLVAADYTVKKEQTDGIGIFLYSLPGSTGFAEKTGRLAERFLRMHSGTLGLYPYRRLSIVETPFPAPFSAPTMILLGQDLLSSSRAEAALGREMLRQWLGNSVYVDLEQGNWAEGISTYLNDHLLAEQDNRDWQYRKQLLIDYTDMVAPGKETTLKDFRIITDPASGAIGVGKGAMVFHMLRRLVGDEAFFRALRNFLSENRFTVASWENIRAVFEKETGLTLDRFFEQWVSGKGALDISIRNREVRITGTGSVLMFEVRTGPDDKQYAIDLPVSVKTDRGEISRIMKISEENNRFETVTEGDPETLILDMNYDLFRRLQDDEVPPLIGRLFSEDKGILVLPEDSDRIPPYSGLINFFTARGYDIREWKQAKDEELRKSSIVLIGHDNPALRRLFGNTVNPVAGFLLTIKKNPLNPSRVIGIADADSAKTVDTTAALLPHYQHYSSLRLTGGSPAELSLSESRKGWHLQLREPVTGVALTKAITLDDVLDRVASRKIIFVGELHDRYQHHLVQLEVIRALQKRNPEIVIGMEMFQRPFQKVLDDFITGSIDEREFLKSSEYFKRWGFDYTLYRDILRFARDKKIPILALNVRKEVISKVSKSGIDSLTDEEKRELPESMDMTDDEYKKRLREVFGQHGSAEGRNFDNFYQSQIIWDEIMAQSIDEYLQKNPGSQMVIIAGGGHVMYSSGIPKRSFRRNRLDYAVILNDEFAEPGIADFIFYPKEAEYLPAPKLMALLKEEEGKVKITGFPEQSVSEKAGLEKGDVIISLNNENIASVQDIQLFLYDKRKGDRVTVRVIRKRFLFGASERDFQVTL